MSKASTYSFGSGNNISFTQEELLTGSKSFLTKDSQLFSELGTEVFKGEFSIDDGLVAFDTSSVLTPQPGTNTTETPTSSVATSTPSSRPYIWKPS